MNYPLVKTSKLKSATGQNPNPLFANSGFVNPVISEELEEGAKPIKVSQAYDYDIATERGEIIIIQ